MPIIHIKTVEDFDDIRNGKLIVKFTAKYCGPCRVIAPEFEKISNDQQYDSFIFTEIDITEVPEIATHYNVSCVPTFMFINRGEYIDGFSGVSKEQLNKLVMNAK